MTLVKKVRSFLAPWKHLAMRAPLFLRYWELVARRAPLEEQIANLPLSPFPKIYWVHLEDIRFNGYIEQSYQAGRFCSGVAWKFPEQHIRTSIFAKIGPDTYRHMIHETIRLMFVENCSHKVTPQYELIMKKMEENPGAVIWGCRTENDVDQLFAGLVDAFETMKRDGYKTQRELGLYNYDEISLYFTDSGELLKGVGGNHRILLAELAGITELPVVLRGSHSRHLSRICQELNCHPMLALAKYIQSDTRFSDQSPAKGARAKAQC